MAAPGARMRLTVVVEALAEENAYGEFRDMALAAFKERKFAMPVQLDDTFEAVWSDIEQRYKTNYLSAQQAAAFSIKKLQDAYDCDLDMTDTVGAIFEGEPDRKMHLIKVVPHFIYRETSVVPGSMLRPAGASKRAGDDANDGASKRRRIESQQRHDAHDTRDASPNRPLLSTESQQAAATMHANVRSMRSQSGMSLLELGRNQTGHTPFASNQVKQEFPPPSHPPALESTSIEPVEHGRTTASEHTAPEHTGVQESVIRRSPVSSVEPAQASVPAPVKKARRDVYHVPSSPEFMHSKATPEKPARTYGRSPRSGAELLNMARRLGRSTEKPGTAQPEASPSTTNTARAFQQTQPDESNSTPRQESGSSQGSNSHTPVNGVTGEDADEDLTASFLEKAAQDAKNVQTPARKPANRPVKPGSLKKPSRVSLVATPARTNRTIKTKAAATPASTMKTNKSDAEDKKVAASAGGSPKGAKVLGEATMSRMERLDKLLNTSQRTPKRRTDANSPAQTGSVKNLQRSHKSSPEVRIPVPKKTLLSHGDAANSSTRPALQSPPVRVTPIQSPVPLPPSKTKTSTPAHAPTSPKIVEVRKSEKPQGFKTLNAKALESSAHSTSLNRPSPSNSITTPKRTEVPLPPNVRHLRRSSSLQSSPLSDGNSTRNGSSFSMPQVTCASINNTTPQSNQRPSGQDATGFAKPTPPAKLAFGSSINSMSPSTDRSNADGEIQHKLQTSDTSVNVIDTQISADLPSNTQSVAASRDNDDPGVVTTAVSTLGPTTATNAHTQSVTTMEPPPQMASQPPSGQASPVGTKDNGRSSESLSCTAHAGDLPQGHKTHPTEIIAAPALNSEDAGFAEQDIYSTAMEDNASISRSGSTNASLRSSPAISRRPARFLSHSPTPDASESEGDSDEASSAGSREASPRHDNKGSESESDISSDSSDDDDVETTDLHAKSVVGTNVNGAPASSPPLTGITNSTPKMTVSQQTTPAKNGQLVNRSPIPLPTQHSSQVLGSSQSVSVKAADRRRYTGFRSLREQLADTKAAQTTIQKKTFDPRTMSLGRLIKAKPTAGLGAGEDESSDDESSSSSSSNDSN